MNHNVPLAHFDRGEAFYPLTMQYVIQLFGFKELAVRSVVAEHGAQEVVGKITGLSPDKFADAANMATNLDKLLGPLSLRSSIRAEPLQVPIDDIGTEVGSNV